MFIDYYFEILQNFNCMFIVSGSTNLRKKFQTFEQDGNDNLKFIYLLVLWNIMYKTIKIHFSNDVHFK